MPTGVLVLVENEYVEVPWLPEVSAIVGDDHDPLAPTILLRLIVESATVPAKPPVLVAVSTKLPELPAVTAMLGVLLLMV